MKQLLTFITFFLLLAGFALAQDTIRAEFETSPVCYGDQTQFINKTYVPSSLGSVNYLWKFGDGTTSTDPFGKRTYKLNDTLKTQTFDVTLVVTSKTNPPEIDSITHQATVYGLPHTYFTYKVNNDGVNQEVYIDSLAVNNAAYFYQWNLGGVLKSNAIKPTFSGNDLKPFVDGKNYSFSLFMRSPENCENQYNGTFNYNASGIEAVTSDVLFFSPNPAHTRIYLDLNYESVVITNLQGQVVMNLDNPGNQIMVSGLSEGLYLVNAKLGNHVYTQRLAIQR